MGFGKIRDWAIITVTNIVTFTVTIAIVTITVTIAPA